MGNDVDAAKDDAVPRQPLAASPPEAAPTSGGGLPSETPAATPHYATQRPAALRAAAHLDAPQRNEGLLSVIERLATNPQLNIEVFDRLLAARREEEDRAAERAFNAALSLAKGAAEPVLKKHQVEFASKDPGKSRTKYKYEEFADIARVIDPVLSQHGLSYRFDVWQQGDKVFCSTVLSHADGYTKTGKPLEGSTAIPPGSNMNSLQALGSALTYLQRYGLRAALGLAAGRDDDAQSLSASTPLISAEQANELERLIADTGSSTNVMLHLYGVESVAELNVDQAKRLKEVLGLRKAEKRRASNAPGQ